MQERNSDNTVGKKRLKSACLDLSIIITVTAFLLFVCDKSGLCGKISSLVARHGNNSGHILVGSWVTALMLLIFSIRRWWDLKKEIDEHIILDDKLKTTTEHFKTLYSRFPISYQSLDRNGNIVEVSSTWLEQLGYTRGEVVGKWFGDFLVDAHKTSFKEDFERFKQTGYIHGRQFEIRSRDGKVKILDLYGHVVKTPDGTFKQTYCIFRDITEIEQYKQSDARKDAILKAVNYTAEKLMESKNWNDSIEEILAMLGRASQVSRAYVFKNHEDSAGELYSTQLYEWSAPGVQSLKGNKMMKSFRPREMGFGRWLDTFLEGGIICGNTDSFPDCERELLLSNKIHSVMSAPVFNDKMLWGNIGLEYRDRRNWTLTEIDSFKTVANMLGEMIKRQAAEHHRDLYFKTLTEQKEQLEDIIRIASHDLRTPLINIKGFARELVKDLDSMKKSLKQSDIKQEVLDSLDESISGDIKQDLRFIEAGTDKIESLLDALLKLARLGKTGTFFEPLNMNNIVRDIRLSMSYQILQKDVSVEIGDLPDCKADKGQIIQVFSNLLSNSLRYLDPSRPGNIRITGEKNGDDAVYCIQDNGLGIEPEYSKRIFEIFYRINSFDQKGQGLGLTIVKRIIDRHRGRIWVASEPGKGSSFYFSIPSEKKTGIEKKS